jgi:TusA-related sulfurtransferase
MTTVDARGLSCPEPVLLARRAIQALGPGGDLEVLVETVTSRENVLRTARSLGCTAEADATPEGGFRLRIHKP